MIKSHWFPILYTENIFDQLRLWEPARDHCISLGGHLFSNITGNPIQIATFCRKMNNLVFWLGIRLDESEQFWKAADDDIARQWRDEDFETLWGEGEPDKNNEKNLLIVCQKQGVQVNALVDGKNNQGGCCASICDMA